MKDSRSGLPSVEILVSQTAARFQKSPLSRPVRVRMAQKLIRERRTEMKGGGDLETELQNRSLHLFTDRLKKVINATGVVLHALGGDQPEWKVLRLVAFSHQLALPLLGEMLPYRQRLVFPQLFVPPSHFSLMPPISQSDHRNHQPFLVSPPQTDNVPLALLT